MSNRTIVIMPAYNAERTLEKTYNDIPRDVVDEIILVDDASQDDTARISKKLGIKTIVHPNNKGYGANQKTCYQEAIKDGADIIIMLHPDYQYSPKIMPDLINAIKGYDVDMILGSRTLRGAFKSKVPKYKYGALQGGMPLYKYLGNLFLTFIQNKIYGINLSDWATGYKAYKAQALKDIPFLANSDGFIFDEELNTQFIYFGYKVDQIPIPTKYFEEASSVSFFQSVSYGLGTLLVILRYLLHKWGIRKDKIFVKN